MGSTCVEVGFVACCFFFFGSNKLYLDAKKGGCFLFRRFGNKPLFCIYNSNSQVFSQGLLRLALLSHGRSSSLIRPPAEARALESALRLAYMMLLYTREKIAAIGPRIIFFPSQTGQPHDCDWHKYTGTLSSFMP